jgi:4-hydroxy-2-oxoheptanedioate aldolase
MLTKSLSLKNRLRARELTFGAWISFPDAAMAEIMAGVGFDWVLIDTEHAPFTQESLARVLMAFSSQPTVPIVRVPWNDRVFIKQALDLGAGGILIPYVCSVEEARQAVAACLYPPQGIRGFGPRRASNYYRGTAEYIQLANEALIVAIQIEHIDAVKKAREILGVPGIDLVLLGPMDLSASLGRLGQLDHPEVVQAIEQVVAEAHLAGIPVGIPIDVPPDVVSQWVDKGCEFIIVGEDHSLLRRAAEEACAQFRHRTADSS